MKPTYHHPADPEFVRLLRQVRQDPWPDDPPFKPTKCIRREEWMNAEMYQSYAYLFVDRGIPAD